MPTTLTRSRPHAARAAVSRQGKPVVRPTYGPGGRFIDEYDRAVAILTRRPRLVASAWTAGYAFREDGPEKLLGRPGLLQMFCARLFSAVPCELGCLTQLRRHIPFAARTAMGRLIADDSRLPKTMSLITPANLPVFAEWQRRIDRELEASPQ